MGFDPDNFLHNRGSLAEVVEVSGQGHCVLDAGGYIFNTEAHPIDPAALACCSGLSEKEVQDQLAGHMVDILNPGSVKEWQGDLVPERLRNLEKKREKEAKERKQREKQAREKLEQLRQQAHAAAAEVKRKEEKMVRSPVFQGSRQTMIQNLRKARELWILKHRESRWRPVRIQTGRKVKKRKDHNSQESRWRT